MKQVCRKQHNAININPCDCRGLTDVKLLPSISRTRSSNPTENTLPDEAVARPVMILVWPDPPIYAASPVEELNDTMRPSAVPATNVLDDVGAIAVMAF